MNGEDENVKDDSCLSEAIDFEFEVVEKLKDVPVSEMEVEMSSPCENSPFDKKIKETRKHY